MWRRRYGAKGHLIDLDQVSVRSLGVQSPSQYGCFVVQNNSCDVSRNSHARIRSHIHHPHVQIYERGEDIETVLRQLSNQFRRQRRRYVITVDVEAACSHAFPLASQGFGNYTAPRSPRPKDLKGSDPYTTHDLLGSYTQLQKQQRKSKARTL